MDNWYDNEEHVARRMATTPLGLLHTLVFHPAVALRDTIAPAKGTDISSITALGIAGATDLGALVRQTRIRQARNEGRLTMEVDVLEPEAYS